MMVRRGGRRNVRKKVKWGDSRVTAAHVHFSSRVFPPSLSLTLATCLSAPPPWSSSSSATAINLAVAFWPAHAGCINMGGRKCQQVKADKADADSLTRLQ